MENERKSLDQRHAMSDLERLRHSAAHVMANAIVKLWPDAQFASGPAVENGFYYDVELEHRISPEDFPKIEAEMKAIIKANQPFEKLVVTREQALADAQKGRLGALAERPAPSKFKLGNLQDIPEGEPISYFKNGDFIDLCAGPHVMRTGNIGAFKLTTVASAYYKGDEKNPQLQRIYGTAFKNKTALDEYFKMLEEAKRRDHRKIGAEMGCSRLTPNTSGRACRCGCPRARCSSRNWRSWPRKPNSPPATRECQCCVSRIDRDDSICWYPDVSQEPEYLNCRCQICSGHIEFPDHGVGEEITCPHCGMNTVLYRGQKVESQSPSSEQIVEPPAQNHALLQKPAWPNASKVILGAVAALFVLWAGSLLYDSFLVEIGVKSSKEFERTMAMHEQRANRAQLAVEYWSETIKFNENLQRVLPSLTHEEALVYLDLLAEYSVPDEETKLPGKLEQLKLLNENTRTPQAARAFAREIKAAKANRQQR